MTSPTPDLTELREATPRTPQPQPAPARPPLTAILAAILAAADDAKRAHDQMCDLVETLLPAPQPTAVHPADVRVGDRVRIVVEGVVILTPDRRIDAADLVGLLGDDAYAQSVYLLHREPEDPRVAVVEEWLNNTREGPADLLARLDAARADR